MIPFLPGTKSAIPWKVAPEVIEHSFTPVIGHHFSAKEFYGQIEETIAAQKAPGITTARAELFEGGLLSDTRTYLRIKRERLVFDVCVAPMGINSFFSYRFIELPVIIGLWEIAALLCGVSVLFWLSVRVIGFFAGPPLVIILFCLSVWYMRNAIGYGLHNLDSSLLEIPVIGHFYERFLRKDTYYRQDTRIMYRNLVAAIIKETVEKYAATKGVKLGQEYSYAPLLDLYRTNPVAVPASEVVP